MNKRAFSKNQIIDMGFPVKEYDFPPGSGSFIGTLVMKKWSNGIGLICYFNVDGGKKYKLMVWFSRKDDRSYRPALSDLDVSYVPIGSRMKVEYEKMTTGKTKWLSAEIISDRLICSP